MSAIKGLLEDKMYDLAEKTGYDVFFLFEMFEEVQDECGQAGDPFSWEYFERVTMEHDW